MDHGFSQDPEVIILKGEISCQHFMRQHRKGILIRSRFRRNRFPLFGRLICRSSAAVVDRNRHDRHGRPDPCRQSEIENRDSQVICDHNISGFDIPVHDFLPVGIIQRGCDLGDDFFDFIRRKRLIISAAFQHHSLQTFPFDIFHNKEIAVVPAGVGFQSFQRSDVCVPQFFDQLIIMENILKSIRISS